MLLGRGAKRPSGNSEIDAKRDSCPARKRGKHEKGPSSAGYNSTSQPEINTEAVQIFERCSVRLFLSSGRCHLEYERVRPSPLGRGCRQKGYCSITALASWRWRTLAGFGLNGGGQTGRSPIFRPRAVKPAKHSLLVRSGARMRQ